MNLSTDLVVLLLPAFAAGCLIALTHVPLGIEVLKRGIIFIDLAIAQIAAMGVVIGQVTFHGSGEIQSLVLALVFALLGGVLFFWLETKKFKEMEAMIGATFIISASITILLLAKDPHGIEATEKLLAGQILWTKWLPDIAIIFIVYLAILSIWFAGNSKSSLLFYFLFPIAITFSVQIAGVYLVFASLIMPAIATSLMTEALKLYAGYAIAFLSIMVGMFASIISDLPAGPVLVCVYFIISVLTLGLSYGYHKTMN